MSKTTVEELVYKISADMNDFKKSMNDIAKATEKAEKEGSGSFDSLGKSLSSFKAMAATFGLAIGVSELVSLGKASLDFANNIGEMSDKVGITTKSLQELRFAASQNGSSIEEMDAALVKFNQIVGDAASGSEEANKTFNLLGISVRNSSGEVRSLDDLLLEASDSISQFGSNSEKAALLTDLFGRAGGKLIPVLGSGSDAVRSFGIEAEKAGIIINDKAIASAKAFDDMMDKLSLTIKAKTANALLGLVDVIKENSSAMLQAAGSFGIYGKLIQVAGAFVNGKTEAVKGLTKAEYEHGELQKRLAAENVKNLAAETDRMNKKAELQANLNAVLKKNYADDIVVKTEAMAKEIEILNKGKEAKLLSDQEYRDELIAREIALQEMQSEDSAKKIEAALAENEMLKGIDEDWATQRMESNRKVVETNTAVLKAGSAEQIKILAARHKAEKEMLWQGLADIQTFGSNVMTLTQNSNKSQFEAAKTVATAVAIMRGFEATQAAFAAAGGWPAGIPAALKTASQAAVNVGRIKGQKFGAEKGVDIVPGIGTHDSVNAMLAPGERVVPRETNKKLESFLQGLGSGGGFAGGKIVIEFKGNLDTLTDLFQAKLEERGVLQLSSQSA